MYSLETGLFPLAAIVMGALLSAIFFGVVRLKCSARCAMNFIFAAMVMMTACGLLSPVRWVEQETAVEVMAQPEETVLKPVKVSQSPKIGDGKGLDKAVANEGTSDTGSAPQPPVLRSLTLLIHNVSNLLGWLWAAGVAVMLLSLMWHLIRLYRLMRHLEYIGQKDSTKVYAINGTDAFSFGRSVFIPSAVDDEMRHFMTLHELAHVRHRHLLWLCLFHVLLAFNWYNPFCWLLLRELRLQQELQVDGDVLSLGVDRTAYQYSLLRAAMQGGNPVWVISAFGHSSIRRRVAFMNANINARSNVRRVVASSLLAFVVLASVTFVACQHNERVKKHPLMGWWKMDFTRNTNSDTELYPFGKQIAFYNHDTFLTMTYRARNGKTLSFTFSTEEIRLRNDTLVNATGEPMRYEFINDNTFKNQWTRQPYQNAMPQGPEITDQWSRIPVDEELLELFQTILRASDSNRGGRFQGVWLDETMTVGKTTDDNNHKEYLLVSDSLFLSIDYHRQEPKAFRAAGNGYCGWLKEYGEYLQFCDMEPVVYDMPDADRLIIRKATNERATPHSLHRIEMPADLKRMLTAPLIQ